jgi:hypothetical protein
MRKSFLPRILIWTLAVALILAGIIFSFLKFVVLPLTPMLDHDLASNYSTIFSRLKAEDLTALGIPKPEGESSLPHSDARRLLQRLHDTDRFPEWKPEFVLRDFKGNAFEFSIRPNDRTDRGAPISSSRKLERGDYIVSIKVSTLSDPVEAP